MTRGVEDEVGAFLARWSRRKAAARRGAPEPEPAASAPAREHVEERPAEPAAGTAGPAGHEPLRTETDIGIDLEKLPDPDTLDAASDFSAFMRPGVPADLRRRALRRLWKVNPIVSTPDGLDDYYVVNDFSDASTVVADLKTLYRVGRGMVAALDEPEPADDAPPGPIASTGAAEAGDAPAPASPAVAEGVAEPADPEAPAVATGLRPA